MFICVYVYMFIRIGIYIHIYTYICLSLLLVVVVVVVLSLLLLGAACGYLPVFPHYYHGHFADREFESRYPFTIADFQKLSATVSDNYGRLEAPMHIHRNWGPCDENLSVQYFPTFMKYSKTFWGLPVTTIGGADAHPRSGWQRQCLCHRRPKRNYKCPGLLAKL